MHGLAVVPHHQIEWPPLMAVDEFPLGGDLGQFLEQYYRQWPRPSDNGARMCRQEQSVSSGRGMSADQRLSDRLEILSFLIGKLAEAKSAARVHQ